MSVAQTTPLVLTRRYRRGRCTLKQQSHERGGLVLALVEEFSVASSHQGAGLRQCRATASGRCLSRMIELLSSSSSSCRPLWVPQPQFHQRLFLITVLESTGIEPRSRGTREEGIRMLFIVLLALKASNWKQCPWWALCSQSKRDPWRIRGTLWAREVDCSPVVKLLEALKVLRRICCLTYWC